ncbi:MAG: hypothetical protein CBD03_05080 [Rhizobiales bacterium TMED143]|nr:MAG: hypothetical protein CBD03_05080 [Rhizobiales bacterium TMED143]
MNKNLSGQFIELNCLHIYNVVHLSMINSFIFFLQTWEPCGNAPLELRILDCLTLYDQKCCCVDNLLFQHYRQVFDDFFFQSQELFDLYSHLTLNVCSSVLRCAFEYHQEFLKEVDYLQEQP